MFSLILVLSLLNYILILWKWVIFEQYMWPEQKIRELWKACITDFISQQEKQQFFLSRIETICWFKGWVVENTICELAYS